MARRLFGVKPSSELKIVHYVRSGKKFARIVTKNYINSITKYAFEIVLCKISPIISHLNVLSITGFLLVWIQDQ